MPLISYLSTLIPVSKPLEAEIRATSQRINVPKNKILINRDEWCHHLYFIEKGLLRAYYYEDGKEITNWFAQEGEFATCFYAFIARQPSYEIIQASENCALVQLPHTALQNLYTSFPETERIGRIITENYYMKLEERLLNIRFKTAKERYQSLAITKPSLLQRASLGQIAAYLGITQETLSRIRAEL